MPDLAGELETELRGMSRRICKDPIHQVRGVLQLVGSDDSDASFCITASTDQVDVARERLRLAKHSECDKFAVLLKRLGITVVLSAWRRTGAGR